jgi:hypothetical protein
LTLLPSFKNRSFSIAVFIGLFFKVAGGGLLLSVVVG